MFGLHVIVQGIQSNYFLLKYRKTNSIAYYESLYNLTEKTGQGI